MADRERILKSEPIRRTAKKYHKPYRIKPVEVYAEPNPDVCSRKTKS